MKNIHILPTDKPSRLFVYDGKLGLAKGFQFGSDAIQNQKIYITSDEEIKEWYIYEGRLLRASVNHSKYELLYGKPIILTTDPDLIKDGVQAIDDDFLEWFVKNPSCEEVEVVKTAPIRPFGSLYKIIIPKEEQTDMMKSDDEEPKKDYSGLHLRHCYQGKHKDVCKYGKDDCPAKPKQETLEEAAEIFVKNRFAKQICNDESYPDIYASKFAIVESHILFAKWQQERSYSEEEVENILIEYVKTNPSKPYRVVSWFTQFKKK